MHDISDLISELIRTANKPRRPDREQVSQLLYEAIVLITNLRRRAGIPAIGTKRDGIVALRDIANEPFTVAEEEVASALLQAADMLRTLRMLIDSDVAITIREHEMCE